MMNCFVYTCVILWCDASCRKPKFCNNLHDNIYSLVCFVCNFMICSVMQAVANTRFATTYIQVCVIK